MFVQLQRVRIAILICSMCFAAGAVSAGTKELSRAIFNTMPLTEDHPSIEARRRFALALEAYFENLDSRLPRLSPKNREWVQGEIEAGAERYERVINSEEYALLWLNRKPRQCLNTIQKVIDSYETEKTRQFEMFYWVRLLNCFYDFDDFMVYLDIANIPYNDAANQHIQIPHVASFTATNTIVNRIVPTAMSETMGWTFGN